MSDQPRKILMIPGPTEYSSAVLSKLGEDSLPQAAPAFIEDMGAALDSLCDVLQGPTATPFILSGSGTLGWDLIAANLCEAGDEVLVVNTGYFSESFLECFEAYSITAHSVNAPIGDSPSLEAVEAALRAHPAVKLITFTQVDTSTAVLNDVAGLSALVRRVAPHVLIAVDGVCSFGAETFSFDEWGIDAAMSCSQKALGAPPGLTTLLLSPRAVSFLSSRRSKVPCYFANLQRWLPIMNNYRARKSSYFATPNVNLVRALSVSLKEIQQYGLARRVADHSAHSAAVKAAVRALGLKQLPVRDELAAHTMTACYYPQGVTASALLSAAAKQGVWLAGGLHKQIAQQHFRIGHMGISVSPWGNEGELLGAHRDDTRLAVKALEAGLKEAGYSFEEGAGVKAYDLHMHTHAQHKKGNGV